MATAGVSKITLELTLMEARVLYEILHHIGGRGDGLCGHSDSIQGVLKELGVVRAGHCLDGPITFDD